MYKLLVQNQNVLLRNFIRKLLCTKFLAHLVPIQRPEDVRVRRHIEEVFALGYFTPLTYYIIFSGCFVFLFDTNITLLLGGCWRVWHTRRDSLECFFAQRTYPTFKGKNDIFHGSDDTTWKTNIYVYER